MGRVIKYSFLLLFVFALIGGGVYFYLKKDGYQVVFNSNGGSLIQTIHTGISGIADRPDDPVKDGYTFAGWYLGEEKFDFDTKLNDNITLTARWEVKQEVMYTLSFDSLGGSQIDDILVLEGNILEDVPTPIKDGYTFIGWYYHNKEFDFSEAIKQDMVLVAHYKSDDTNKTTVTVTFDSSGGSEVEAITLTVGDIAKMPKAPTRDGYTFAGWYLNDEEFDFLDPINEDIILTAKWSKE